MKPNGLVDAALIISLMSICNLSQNIASSLTSEIFTNLNVFSNDFTTSATLDDDTRLRFALLT